MAVNSRIPQSRLMIQYETKVDGTFKKKELPYRILLMGDLSNGLSKNAQQLLEYREPVLIQNGINNALKNMEITLDMKVANVISPSKKPHLDIKYSFESMADFRPDQIAKKIPELNALSQLKVMLARFSKEVDNNKQLKKTLDKIFSSPEELEKLRKNIPLLKDYNMEKTVVATIDKETTIEGEVINDETQETS